MISFSQLLFLLFVLLLLFGDIRQIFNKIILFFVNLKTLVKKKSSDNKEKKN